MLFTAQVRPWQLAVNVGAGGWLFVGSTMVTACACRGGRDLPLVPDRQRHLERCAHGARSGEGPVGSAPLPLTVEPEDVPKFHV